MTDYSLFTISDFDANDYANAILAGEPYPQVHQTQYAKPRTGAALESAKEDISVAISKLDLSIEDVSKQIKNLVTTHHEELLQRAAGVNNLSGSLTSVRRGLDDVDASLEKLRQKIRVPYQNLETNATRLQRIRQASDALRRISRFVVLSRRLETQMSELAAFDKQSATEKKQKRNDSEGLSADQQDDKERTIAKAALTIAELGALLDGPEDTGDTPGKDSSEADDRISPAMDSLVSLRSVKAAAVHIPFIEEAQYKVTHEMQSMIRTGLSTLDQSLLASSLQTAYNLGALPMLVQGLSRDLCDAVEERIRTAFDLSRISKEVVSRESAPSSQGLLYKSRVRTEPTNITAPQWTAALWARLESLIEEMASCCIKVYTLEKVLKLKKDPVTQRSFLDDVMKVLENKPSSIFWTSLGRSLEKYARDAAKGSTFLQQTLSSGYPKFLRLFHEFFAKIAVHTDTVYTQSQQSPETVLVLHALSTFEALYLSRSTTRLNEAISQAFAGGSRSPPGANEGVTIARAVMNELDSARFDPLLILAVARNIATALDGATMRAESLISSDRSAVALLGPIATPQQILNGQVATCLYHCWTKLEKVAEEYSESAAALVRPSVKKLHTTYDGIVDPLLMAIRRELASIVSRLHRVDLQKTMDPMAGMAGPSLYMKDLADKLNFVKTQVFINFTSEVTQSWVLSIVKYVIRIFVLHASIAKPLGESGKLQLTTDMTELEFALGAFLGPSSKRGLEVAGEEYKMLRAMRPLLFLDTPSLAVPTHASNLPPLVVLHHILVRSPLPLPHIMHGWQEAEYVRWVEEHREEEAWGLVEAALVGKEGEEYVELARRVLRQARGE
ncbi:Golgi transport complex subunit 5-domain-containing protein [Suillus paluster]|uniref:Golgi transport complex subunit 5-domain-containing protein n=1 Tax=Suillus paluster TaxID=48578 RepID=UPI001B876094|nr:Golgi transport complex subunit 5-domain-containing protein [Suillus paluster]KAG1731465.1 Golgi transport complex subunit 5-domain-containing protein [Suillus paluster]